MHDLRLKTDLYRLERDLDLSRRAVARREPAAASPPQSIRYRVPFLRRPALEAAADGGC
jgi:hypothetical protein